MYSNLKEIDDLKNVKQSSNCSCVLAIYNILYFI